MSAPNKIYIQEGAILRTEKTYDNDVCYVRLDILPEQPVTDCHDLEQEQDLDSEIFAWQKAHANEDTAQVIAMTARHFYELGQQSRPKISDNFLGEAGSEYKE